MNLARKIVGTLLATSMLAALSAPASAFYRYKTSLLSDTLSANGFGTLLFALDATDLTPILDSNYVTLFAPTDDVFEATATLLGCSSVGSLAGALLDIEVDDEGTDALTAILTYHAVLRKLGNERKLISKKTLYTVNGAAVEVGVDANGLYVKGDANGTNSSITTDGLTDRRYAIYGIDQILLPFAPPADLCPDED